ncbi:hypothetical protein FRC04_008864 [Tulasnella sp. 424]|nr:hypothetical protein FRC04_008864 [Tulasnella sp. 424]KAG8973766.1 hypothetical protein FRC05_008185 [Tulasnella sp. 425]
MSYYLLTLSFLAGQVLAAAVLTGPAPGAIYYEGSSCIIQWNPDTTGTWKNMTIDLMSGPNLSMTKVTTVATGLDGSDSSITPFNWTCPQVTPCSAIYFYQIYDSSTQDSPSWTGRFTIASPHGASIAPPNATQPDGEAIPWGFGSLASNSTSIPLPSTAAPTDRANSTATAASSVSTGESNGSTQQVSSWGKERPHSGKSREHGKDEEDEGNDDDRGDEGNDDDDDPQDEYDDDDQYDHHGKHDDGDDGKNNDQGTNHGQNSDASSAGNTQNTPQTTASFNSMADRNVHGANQIPVPGARSLAADYTSNAARELAWSAHTGMVTTLCWLIYFIV